MLRFIYNRKCSAIHFDEPNIKQVHDRRHKPAPFLVAEIIYICTALDLADVELEIEFGSGW